MEEGTIKFNVREYINGPDFDDACIKELQAWRNILKSLNLIGVYEKSRIGYGNLSKKIAPPFSAKNKKEFIITGSQTSGLEQLTREHYTVVFEYYPEKNEVVSLERSVKGERIKPSSESMTHGAIYDENDSVMYVFHSHSPEIWRSAKRLEIPITDRRIREGTPEMYGEVKRIFKESDVLDKKIFVMGGHEDGVISFGKNSEEAGTKMLYYLYLARQHPY